MSTVVGIGAYHAPDFCAAGKCAHAVSARNPCRCPDCDPLTAQQVAAYRTEAAQRLVAKESETTPRFRDRTFERFERDAGNEAAYCAARGVAAQPTRGLGLWGPFGVGKSHLAAAVVNACNADDILSRFIGVEELLGKLRATYDRAKGSSDTENSVLRGYATIPVLVLDDLGKESLSDWAVRTLYSLVNRRYEQNLPLIVTSNISLSQLCARSVGRDAEANTYRATMDRVVEMSGTWVAMEGASRR